MAQMDFLYAVLSVFNIKREEKYGRYKIIKHGRIK